MTFRKGWGRPLFSALCFACVALVTLHYGSPLLALLAFWCLGGSMVMTAWANPVAGFLLTAALVGGAWGFSMAGDGLSPLLAAAAMVQALAPGLVTGLAWRGLRGRWAIGTAALVTYVLFSVLWFGLLAAVGSDAVAAAVVRSLENLRFGGLGAQQVIGAAHELMVEMPSFLLYWALLAVFQCYAMARLLGRYRALAPGPVTDWAHWGPLPVRYAFMLLAFAVFGALELFSGPAAAVIFNLEKALQIGFHMSGFALLWAGTLRRRITGFGFAAGLFRVLLVILFMIGYQWYTSILLYVGLFYSFSGLNKIAKE